MGEMPLRCRYTNFTILFKERDYQKSLAVLPVTGGLMSKLGEKSRTKVENGNGISKSVSFPIKQYGVFLIPLLQHK